MLMHLYYANPQVISNKMAWRANSCFAGILYTQTMAGRPGEWERFEENYVSHQLFTLKQEWCIHHIHNI